MRHGSIISVSLAASLLFGAASAARADITTDLVGYWPFSGDAQDASGNGNHGTPNATAVLTVDRAGNQNSAFLFDGLSARIDIPPSASLASPVEEITLAAWIRRDGWGLVGSMYNPILTKSVGTANAFQYRLIVSQSGVGTSLNNWNIGGGAPFDFPEGTWHHVASTWADDTLRTYVDGILLDTDVVATTIVPDGNSLSIGSDTPGVLEIFLGAIDEVRIYARALSDADIAELAGPITAAPVTTTASVELGRAWPNPTRGATRIPFSLNRPAPVVVEVLDVAGRRVRTLLPDRALGDGAHEAIWDGRDDNGATVAAGVYVYRLRGAGENIAGKVVVQR
ncbi:MAG: hypothetical protein KC591_01165 [Gemmatimonadetes bacterium]|nr:hypothetical protein [Gemmatimonadota bacterium]